MEGPAGARDSNGDGGGPPPADVDFAAIVAGSPDITLVLAADGRIAYASPATGTTLRREASSLVGYPLAGLIHPDDRLLFTELVEPGAERPGPTARRTVRLSHVNGSWVSFEAVASGAAGSLRVLNLRDITERLQEDEQLRELALHDPLTMLANRTLFRDHVRRALNHLRRTPVEHGVLFLDLDDFKMVNDSLGHAAGDLVLVTVADRLRSRLRPHDLVARLGGDEFAVLVENTSERDVVELAGRILDALQLPVVVHNRRVVPSGSVGIAMSAHAEDDEQFLRNADLAMYRAKSSGKGRYVIFKPEMHLAAVKRLDLEADLRRAIGTPDVFLQYQPIVDLKTGEVAKLEALVRWRHPDRGMVRPDEFIPVAEDSGLIHPLGLAVLRGACRQARRWHDRFPDRRRLGVSVNASVRQLESEGFTGEVARCLAESGLDPAALTLEITESVLLADFTAILEKLHELRGLGVTLALDDFGTGYSSLSYLRRLPVEVLKIDKSFVDGVTAGPEQSAVARAIVKLARTFDLCTVAEGIELPEQAYALQLIGADLGQGYFFAKPLGVDEVDALLSRPRDLGGRRHLVGSVA